MTHPSRWIPAVAVLLAACNIEVSSPNNIDLDGHGSTRLPPPSNLVTISLDGSVQLSWSGSIVASYPEQFRYFRVYSTQLDVSGTRCDESDWVTEGTTVSDGFLVGSLRNGVTRCFAVTTVAQDGGEGSRTAARMDTPRHGGRFVIVDVFESRPATSGWLFEDGTSGRIGVVGNGSRSDLDFRVERHVDGSLWFRPVRAGGRVQVYGTVPIADLTSVDRAPVSGYASVQVEALPGFAYLFAVPQFDGTHYGAVRVAFLSPAYVVLDWSYQIDPNNVELFKGMGGTDVRRVLAYNP
ncbi:MAG: hypothetical protein V4550_16760 [Gemmatimonadota bacterium]